MSNTKARVYDPAMQEEIVDVPGQHTVDQTVDAIQRILQSKGIMLFAVIDHSGEAAKVGITMPPTKLVIFGNPKAGTPLMLAAPSIALDLPLKILVRQDKDGKTWLSYNSPEFLQQRHNLPADLVPVLAGVAGLADKAAQ
jgi:uncharacterized protein (DUF302 family)